MITAWYKFLWPLLCRRDRCCYEKASNFTPRYYVNDTGTGNTLNLSHGRVIQMVLDSLRYWVQQTKVDGFRFDLGTILAREPNGFDNQSGFLKACTQDAVLNTVKLIAEPWDCGPGGYQVGEFPTGLIFWKNTHPLFKSSAKMQVSDRFSLSRENFASASRTSDREELVEPSSRSSAAPERSFRYRGRMVISRKLETLRLKRGP
jgi:pullulanase/glycogen debranching enzyme